MIHLYVGVRQVHDCLHVIGDISQLRLELVRCLLVLSLGPQQVSQTEVHIRLVGIRLDSRTELLHGAGVVLHFIQRFAGQHIRLGRFRI